MLLDHAIKHLEPHELVEFMQLLSYKVLLISPPDEWKASPNEFINLCIPQNVSDYVKGISKGDPVKFRTATDLLIRDLVIRGIKSISDETGGIECIDEMMSQIIEGGMQEQ